MSRLLIAACVLGLIGILAQSQEVDEPRHAKVAANQPCDCASLKTELEALQEEFDALHAEFKALKPAAVKRDIAALKVTVYGSTTIPSAPEPAGTLGLTAQIRAFDDTLTTFFEKDLPALHREVKGIGDQVENLFFPTPENGTLPSGGPSGAPKVFGRMTHNEGEKKVASQKYLEDVQRATNGKLMIRNNCREERTVFINGAPWTAWKGPSYIWVPMGPVSVSDKGGVEPTLLGVPGSTEHKWEYDSADNAFHLEYTIP